MLFIDGDSQANATTTLLDGMPPELPTIAEVLIDECGILEAIRPSRIARVDILPSTPQLADCTVWLSDQIGREQRLETALQDVRGMYDLVIVDAPPSLSLVSVNILRAVSELIVPVDCGIYSVMGLSRLNDTVEKIRRHLAHPELCIIGLLISRAQRNRASRDLEAQLRETYGDLVYQAVVPFSSKVEEGVARHRTVLEYAPGSPAAVAFESLVREVLQHGRKRGHARRSGRIDQDAA